MRFLLLTCLMSAVAFSEPGVNVSGKWVIAGTANNTGQMRPSTILIVNQVGSEVTGTISSGTFGASASPTHTEILDGKVEGDSLTFYVWSGMDRPVKAYYKGTLAGEELKFTVTGGARFGGPATSGAGPQEPRQMTAKRMK